MCVSALDVADYIIEHEARFHRPRNYLRLQKLLYFVQVVHLIKENKPCFKDDLMAKPCGPCVKCIEEKYEIFGLVEIPVNKNRRPLPFVTEDIIDDVLVMCKSYGNSDMFEIIVRQKPYIDAMLTDKNIITIQSIIEYFKV